MGTGTKRKAVAFGGATAVARPLTEIDGRPGVGSERKEVQHLSDERGSAAKRKKPSGGSKELYKRVRLVRPKGSASFCSCRLPG